MNGEDEVVHRPEVIVEELRSKACFLSNLSGRDCGITFLSEKLLGCFDQKTAVRGIFIAEPAARCHISPHAVNH
jgi:hypothetical protein